jgi:hypothetical protein
MQLFSAVNAVNRHIWLLVSHASGGAHEPANARTHRVHPIVGFSLRFAFALRSTFITSYLPDRLHLRVRLICEAQASFDFFLTTFSTFPTFFNFFRICV